MKKSSYFTALAAACSLLCLATPASAVVINVLGNSNPWNALSSTGDGLAPPSFAVSAGATVAWTATGTVNTGGSNPSAGPDGNTPLVSHNAQNGVSGLTNINQGALIGVWSTGAAFVMGAGGSVVAPAGATALYMGIMDDGFYVPGWDNNVGSFDVTIAQSGGGGGGTGVPDSGSTLALMLIPLGLMFLSGSKLIRV